MPRRKRAAQPAKVRRRKARAIQVATTSSVFHPVPRDLMEREFEAKAFDASASASNTTNAGVIVNCSLVPQGVAQSQRVGDAINVEAIEVRVGPTAANAVGGTVRVLLVRALEPSASFAVNTVLGITGSALAAIGPLNFTGVRQEDFAILHDELMMVPATAGASFGRGQNMPLIHIRKSLKSRIQFDAAATTGTGHIFLIMISDVVTTGPSLNYHSRLIYSDG